MTLTLGIEQIGLNRKIKPNGWLGSGQTNKYLLAVRPLLCLDILPLNKFGVAESMFE